VETKYTLILIIVGWKYNIMSKVSGVLVENISKVLGVSANLIKFIGPINTLDLPGWPGNLPTCTSLTFSFGPAPGVACAGSSAFYDFDVTNNLIYQPGYCGNSEYYAAFGFYVNENSDIYEWAGGKEGPVWSYIGSCI
jgi:hypothetical protein